MSSSPNKASEEDNRVLRAVVHEIEHRFHVTHTTVQVKVEGCNVNDMYWHCQVEGVAGRVGR